MIDGPLDSKSSQALSQQPLVSQRMTDPSVTKVFEALGYPEVDVRFVGGCVRDALLDRATTDIDIATPDTPSVVSEKLLQAGLKVVPTGLSHGTVTAVAAGTPFEITTLRKDTACDGRHAAVEFTTDWLEDASRRDFTFNAMSLRPDGVLFDPFDGVADAQAGVVRFVGEAGDRIQEDYLRILRYFRFLAHYGKAPPAPEVLGVCQKHRPGLANLSSERVRMELVKLLKARDPIATMVAVSAMIETDVLPQIVGGKVDGATFAGMLRREQTLVSVTTRPDWQTRWVALFEAQATRLSKDLKCSGKDQKRIVAVVAAAARAEAAFLPPVKHRFLYNFGPDAAAAGVLVAWARHQKVDVKAEEAKWLNFYTQARAWRSPHFPLTGADAKAFGAEEGPRIGEMLAELETQWVESGFSIPTGDLRAALKALIQRE